MNEQIPTLPRSPRAIPRLLDIHHYNPVVFRLDIPQPPSQPIKRDPPRAPTGTSVNIWIRGVTPLEGRYGTTRGYPWLLTHIDGKLDDVLILDRIGGPSTGFLSIKTSKFRPVTCIQVLSAGQIIACLDALW